jgi:hypothetical protein
MLVQTNTRCAPPELYRETGFAAARLLENELRDSVRQLARSGYTCPDDTNVTRAVAENFFGGAGRGKLSWGNSWSPIKDIVTINGA